MKAIKPVLLLALIAAVAAGAFIWGKHANRGAGATTTAAESGSPGHGKILYWKSTMVPGETSKHPGKDSMGMDMVPVYANSAAAAAKPGEIAVNPVEEQDLDIQTTPVLRGPLRRTIRTVGYVDYDEPKLTDITTKFKGWIEKLYVNYTGQLVHRGQPLFKIYSPELYSAEVEYLTALESSATNDAQQAALLEAAKAKLRFFDVSEGQIAALARTRIPLKAMDILSPADGFVIEKKIFVGQVDVGTTLYRLADLRTVWVYADVYEQDLPYVQLGQEATMTLSYLPGRTFQGRVTYIYPTVNETTRTAKVRLEFENPDYSLKPGMFANVTLTAQLSSAAVLVPDSAVLRSGERDTVFVALPEGRFDPRTVKLGLAAADGYDQVLSGVEPGERVVTSGEFMLDSESQLQEAIQKMLTPAKAAAPTNAPSPATNPPTTSAAETNMPAGMNMPGMNMGK